MSYDALVWLLVGLGIGVAASLMLLIGYSTLEYGRLSRRFRRARVAAAAAAGPVAETTVVAPKTSILARSTPRPAVAAKPEAEAKPMAEAKPAVVVQPMPKLQPAAEPKSTTAANPARSALVGVAGPEPKPVPAEKPAPARPTVEAKPVVAPFANLAAAPPKGPQSVEAMFAEAFANDRLTVSPEPDEAAGAAKPGAEKPPG